MLRRLTTSPLPLPLTPFERYMLGDDRAAYPMVFPVSLEFLGVARRAALEEAVEEALARHPLLRANVEGGWPGTGWWVEANDAGPLLEWTDPSSPASPRCSEAMDLRRQTGLRLALHQGTERAILQAQFHHACCDGIGALRFLGEVLAGYAMRTANGDRPRWRPADPRDLPARAEFQTDPPQPVGRFQATRFAARETLRWLMRRPMPIASPSDRVGVGLGAACLPIETRSLGRDDHRALRRAASCQGATVNDLLMRDLFLTLADWSTQCGAPRSNGWLQVTMPASLRQRLADSMPAANKMSYSFLARRMGELADPVQLLQGIAAETAAIRQWGMAGLFLAGMGWALKVPGLVTLMTSAGRCFATTVLTNLGDLSRRLAVRLPRRNQRLVCGDLVLEGCRGVPPLRPQTRAVFAVLAYAGSLHINLQCDPRFFSQRSSRALLEAYVRRIEGSLASYRA